MRTFKGVGGTSYVDDFDGITDLTETVKSRPLNPRYDSYLINKHDCFGRTCQKDSRWAGFSDSKEALDTFQFGTIDHDLEEQVTEFSSALYIEHATPKDMIEFMPFGGIISIPKVIAQSSDYKVIPLTEDRQDKTIELGIDGAVSAFVDADDIKRVGLAIMGMIAHLEAEGYNLRVRLLTTNRNIKDKKILSMSMLLKDYSDVLDMSRILMPIITPAFHRIVMFGWMVRHEESDGAYGMGTPLRHSMTSDEMAQYYKDVFNLDHVINIQTFVKKDLRMSPEEIEQELVKEVLEGAYA